MAYICLVLLATLMLLANALPIAVDNNIAFSLETRSQIITRDLADSDFAAEGTNLNDEPVNDSSSPLGFSIDQTTKGIFAQSDDSRTQYSPSSNDDLIIASTPQPTIDGQECSVPRRLSRRKKPRRPPPELDSPQGKPLRCPFNQNLDGYAVYLAEFWRTPFNPNNFHQGILVQEIGNKNNELLYDVSGDFAEGGFKMRKREFDSKYFPYLDTRLVEILMPKEKLPLLEAIMANTPPPQCAADGNCQTWVKQVLDKAIPNPIKPVSLDKLVDF